MSKYVINIVLILAVALPSYAQQDTVTVKQTQSKFGLYSVRIGVDLVKPVTQIIQKQDLGYEFTLDIGVAPNWYVALEAGYESEPGNEDFLTFHTKGLFTKLGFNYNIYEDWAKLDNEIYVGLRYGYSKFQQHLISYQSLDVNGYFGSELQTPNRVYGHLNGHWIEAVAGIKAQVLKNVYLTVGVQVKRHINSDIPDGFANLYIPGFRRVYVNKIGVGVNYTIAYKIPLKKRT